MSQEIMLEIKRHIQTKTRAKHLLYVLAFFADDWGRGVLPRIDVLAKRMGRSPRTVQRWLAFVQAQGLVIIVRGRRRIDAAVFAIKRPWIHAIVSGPEKALQG